MFELLEYKSIIERLNSGVSADRKSVLIQIVSLYPGLLILQIRLVLSLHIPILEM